ncbi:hypothetical protein TRFO_37948 [Tritrichomonas foetus]|uniref:Uncharacterized protein n=1 Tax=Tritrichomonas foetus TaxID=1144522 RepID=A0A1J4JE30_9EUKA|nr:hypothetical protein TRFO_37948 [Tritrichomonas foetus]|eukprot:OHS95923.1 hypothetical protein TRFO_37948 [Tritrichomonas foetus]
MGNLISIEVKFFGSFFISLSCHKYVIHLQKMSFNTFEGLSTLSEVFSEVFLNVTTFSNLPEINGHTDSNFQNIVSLVRASIDFRMSDISQTTDLHHGNDTLTRDDQSRTDNSTNNEISLNDDRFHLFDSRFSEFLENLKNRNKELKSTLARQSFTLLHMNNSNANNQIHNDLQIISNKVDISNNRISTAKEEIEKLQKENQSLIQKIETKNSKIIDFSNKESKSDKNNCQISIGKINSLNDQINDIEKQLLSLQRNYSISINKDRQEIDRRKIEIDAILSQISNTENRIELMSRSTNRKAGNPIPITLHQNPKRKILMPTTTTNNNNQTNQANLNQNANGRRFPRRCQRIIFKKPLKPMDPSLYETPSKVNSVFAEIDDEESHKASVDALLKKDDNINNSINSFKNINSINNSINNSIDNIQNNDINNSGGWTPNEFVKSLKSPYEYNEGKSDIVQNYVEIPEAPNTEPKRVNRLSTSNSKDTFISPPNSADSNSFFARQKCSYFEEEKIEDQILNNVRSKFLMSNEDIPKDLNDLIPEERKNDDFLCQNVNSNNSISSGNSRTSNKESLSQKSNAIDNSDFNINIKRSSSTDVSSTNKIKQSPSNNSNLSNKSNLSHNSDGQTKCFHYIIEAANESNLGNILNYQNENIQRENISEEQKKKICAKSPLTDDLLRIPLSDLNFSGLQEVPLTLCSVPIMVRNSSEFFSRNNSEKRNAYKSDEEENEEDGDNEADNELKFEKDQENAEENIQKESTIEDYHVTEPTFQIDNFPIGTKDRAPRPKPGLNQM